MNVFDRASHRWRKGRKRGVSPIIATILLVAITVVLAAVLYVLISGLTKTGASTPYSLGMGINGATGPAGTPASYYVTLSIAPTTGLTTGIMGLSVTNVNGATQANTAASTNCVNAAGSPTTNCVGTAASGWYAVLVTSSGTVAATFSGGVWANLGTATTIALTGAYSLIIVTEALYDGQGYTLNAYGTGSSTVSGSVSL